MVYYKSIDQSQFAEGDDIEEQERRFDDFLKNTLSEIQCQETSNDVAQEASSKIKPAKKLLVHHTEDKQATGNATEVPYVFLKTCNRSELYYGEGDMPDEVTRHLFRVVSGLESAIVGERAVQGQVKEAYYNAKAQRHLPAELHKLFLAALQVGKRVRNETEISHGAVSHSLAALEIIEDEILKGNKIDAQRNDKADLKKSLQDAHITIIGVNKLTADILKFLQNKGAKMVFLANRSQIKAHYIADPLGIKVYTLDEKKDFLAHTDILISATSAPHLIIRKDDIPKDKSMLAIDLAFPRDIDSSLNELPHVHLFNIRDVEKKVRQNLDVREAEVKKAEAIIEEEIKELNEALERRKFFLGRMNADLKIG